MELSPRNRSDVLKNIRTIAGKRGWLKINSGESAFFRTAYSPKLLEKLRLPLRAGKLSELDRLGLIRDAFALAEGGVSETTEALKLAADYRGETSYTVWAELALQLRKVFNLISDLPAGRQARAAESYKKFALGIFEQAVKKVGWRPKAGESQNQTLLRSLILGNAGEYGHSETVAKARKLFGDFLKKGKLVRADLRGAVYALAAEYSGEKEFNKAIALYKKETLHEEQGRLGHALASFKQKKLLQKTLGFALSKDVRSQDTLSIIAGVWGNNAGRALAWAFVKKNWPTFLERYGSGGYALSRLVKCASVFHTRAEYNDFKKFFRSHSAPGASRAVEQVLEKIDGNIRWLSRDGKAIENWLAKKKF